MLWVFIAVFILGTSLWSFYILLKQKKGWEAFAKKHEFHFSPVSFQKSPYLRGLFNGFEVIVFSDYQLGQDERKQRLRTVFQILFKTPTGTEAVIVSPDFRNFVNGLSLPETYVPEFDGWNKDIIIRARNIEAIKSYLNKDRLTALNALLGIKGSPVAVLFGDAESALRVESTDPFSSPEKMERFLSKLTEAAKVISA